jgi:hypothetical protein
VQYDKTESDVRKVIQLQEINPVRQLPHFGAFILRTSVPSLVPFSESLLLPLLFFPSHFWFALKGDTGRAVGMSWREVHKGP